MWGEAMATHFGSSFDDVYVQNYDHWIHGNETIDFEAEAHKLHGIIQNEADTEYVIFAKSFGSILALQSVFKNFIKPTQCVFFGMPLNVVEAQDIFKNDWSPLSTFAIPAIAFQNTHDPVANYEFVLAKLGELAPAITVIPMEADTHGYDTPELYEEAIQAFLKA